MVRFIDYAEVEPIEDICGEIRDARLKIEGVPEISFAQAKMTNLSEAHYHKKTPEVYIVRVGEGRLRTRHSMGPYGHHRFKEVELHPGVLVVIDPLEIHQTNPTSELTLDVIAFPWTEEDEFPVDMNLFDL